MKITPEWLRSHGACVEGTKAVVERFPDGAEIAETFAAEPLSTLVFDSLAKPHAERKGVKR